MVVGTLPLVQKGQTSGCTGCSTQWTQYVVDAVEYWYMVVGLSLIEKGQSSGGSTQYTVDAVE